ncbi:hypothetical protein KRP22_009718 [Phytophthora ramorum]|nr:hypothetical protein KRP22_14664 [Phytophthora ramorum]
MSDFTDAEDRQLVQLALVYQRKGRQIMWGQVALQMRDTKKSKEVLRQRLKTLKRTHGRNLEKFPKWFFKGSSTQRLHTNTSVKLVQSDNLVQFVKKRGCKPRRNKTVVTLGTLTTKLERPKCFPKCASTTRTDPPSSLLLLASVASTPRNEIQSVDD